MLNCDEVEIRDHLHLMSTEGKHDNKPSENDVIDFLKLKGLMLLI